MPETNFDRHLKQGRIKILAGRQPQTVVNDRHSLSAAIQREKALGARTYALEGIGMIRPELGLLECQRLLCELCGLCVPSEGIVRACQPALGS
jgi:hypothetical protein